MKPYTIEIDIDLPRATVIELFDDSDNMPKWQPGLQSFERLSGEPGEPGSKSKLVYLNGKHRVELIETVTERNPPDVFNGTYEWKGGRNTLDNRFIELGPERTRWQSTCTYELDGVVMKLMGMFFPNFFRKQNLMFMKNFKALCEDGTDIRDQK